MCASAEQQKYSKSGRALAAKFEVSLPSSFAGVRALVGGTYFPGFQPSGLDVCVVGSSLRQCVLARCNQSPCSGCTFLGIVMGDARVVLRLKLRARMVLVVSLLLCRFSGIL